MGEGGEGEMGGGGEGRVGEGVLHHGRDIHLT